MPEITTTTSRACTGAPTRQLVAAVADFLDGDARANTEGQVNFHARVAANALRMVQRELESCGAADVTAALNRLGASDEEELAAAIRRGDLTTVQAISRACGSWSGIDCRPHPGYETE
jgi:hypothetical protein